MINDVNEQQSVKPNYANFTNIKRREALKHFRVEGC